MAARTLLASSLLLLLSGLALAQSPRREAKAQRTPNWEGATVHTYKTVGDAQLKLYAFAPEGHSAKERRPAIVFFFGGGWRNGKPEQFEPHCRYLATRGMVAMTADYRVSSRYPVQAKDCVADAISAVSWIREHADQLGIDPNRLAVGGGSAGGHLAACTATLTDFQTDGVQASSVSMPNALVLFNPAMALAGEGKQPGDQELDVGMKRLGMPAAALSPASHVRADLPPTIMFFGTEDFLLSGAKEYERLATEKGDRCELKLYDGYAHGFFNYGRFDNKPFRQTVTDADKFLASLGYVKGPPSVDAWMAK